MKWNLKELAKEFEYAISSLPCHRFRPSAELKKISKFVESKGENVQLIVDLIVYPTCQRTNVNENRTRFVHQLFSQILLVGASPSGQEKLAQLICRRMVLDPRLQNFLNDHLLSSYFVKAMVNLDVEGFSLKGKFFPMFLGALEMASEGEQGKTIAFNLLDRYLTLYGEDIRLFNMLKEEQTIVCLQSNEPSPLYQHALSQFEVSLTILIKQRVRETATGALPPQELIFMRAIFAIYCNTQ